MVEENSVVATGQRVSISTSIGETTKHDYVVQDNLDSAQCLVSTP